MNTFAPELSALMIILRSAGPVISTRRSCRSAGIGGDVPLALADGARLGAGNRAACPRRFPSGAPRAGPAVPRPAARTSARARRRNPSRRVSGSSRTPVAMFPYRAARRQIELRLCVQVRLQGAAATRRERGPGAPLLQRNKRIDLGLRHRQELISTMRLILLNKPFQVLPQFTSPDERRCLRDFVPLPGVYPAGRLDYDSEGPDAAHRFRSLAGADQPAGARRSRRSTSRRSRASPDDAGLQRLRRRRRC